MRKIKHLQQFCTMSKFQMLERAESEELELVVERWRHEGTGMHVYHLRTSDGNSAYSSVTKTLASNDKGCPHILEHLACCGSEKYPIRDPFFNMLRRSVNSYMNAWTGEDFTAYPFSSPNVKDFHNLLMVYSDMVWKPTLHELDFRQEGWRYEVSDEGQRQLKGIVLNEMKGAYQNTERQLNVETYRQLFQGTSYQYDSGGSPASIVTLSYPEILEMHQHYYHPSNTSLFFYTNHSIHEHLHYLHQHYLSQYTNKTQQYMKEEQVKVGEQFHQLVSDNVEVDSVGISYWMGNLHNITEVDQVCMKILSYVLLDGNQALLYEEFVEGGSVEALGHGGYWVGSMCTWNVVLRGVKLTPQEYLSQLKKVLRRIWEDGVKEERLGQYMQQVQLDMLTPKQNNGIRLLEVTLPYLNNKLSLRNITNMRKTLHEAVKKMANKQQVKKVVEKYFLNNHHKVVITQKKGKKEEQFHPLPMDDAFIRAQQQHLRQRQTSVNDIECLPKITIPDLINPTRNHFSLVEERQMGRMMHKHVRIACIPHFLRVVFTVPSIDSGMHEALHLWVYTLNKGISTSTLTHTQLNGKLNQISSNLEVFLEKGEGSELHIVFQSSCLGEHMTSLVGIIREILADGKYDEQNCQHIFDSYHNQMTQALLDAPITQCLDHCASYLSQKGALFDSYSMITRGLQLSRAPIPEVFQAIPQLLINQAQIQVIEHSKKPTEKVLDVLQFHLKEDKLKKENNDKKAVVMRKGQFKAITHNYEVNFCCQAYPAPPSFSQDHAYMALLLEILQHNYLHPKIREEGGAYGARAQIRNNDTITLYSYMDPNAAETFFAFDQSIAELLSSSISPEQINEAKIKIIGKIDNPQAPQDQCVSSILRNYSNKAIEQFRNLVLNASQKNLLDVGSVYLCHEKKHCVLIGNQVPEGFCEQKLKITP